MCAIRVRVLVRTYRMRSPVCRVNGTAHREKEVKFPIHEKIVKRVIAVIKMIITTMITIMMIITITVVTIIMTMVCPILY